MNVTDLRPGDWFLWVGITVEVLEVAPVPARSRRTKRGRYLLVRECLTGVEHRLHYLDDETVEAQR